MSTERPPSSSISVSGDSLTRRQSTSTHSAVLEQLLTQFDSQESLVKTLQLQQQSLQRSSLKTKETLSKHDNEIAQLQSMLQNILAQQSTLTTFIHPNHSPISINGSVHNDNNSSNNNLSPQQSNNPVLPSFSPSSSSSSSREVELANKINIKDEEIKSLITQNNEQQHRIDVLTRAYNQMKIENEKSIEKCRLLEQELLTVKGEHSQCLEKKSGETQTQLIKVKHVHDSIDSQLSKHDKDDWKANTLKTALQLFIIQLNGQAILLNVRIEDTIAIVKAKISEEIKAPVKDMILIDKKSGKELDNEKSLLQLGVMNHTMLHLLFKNRAK